MVVQGTNSCNSLGRLRPFCSVDLRFFEVFALKDKNLEVIKYSLIVLSFVFLGQCLHLPDTVKSDIYQDIGKVSSKQDTNGQVRAMFGIDVYVREFNNNNNSNKNNNNNNTLIEKDHLGDWSPEKDCYLRPTFRQPVPSSSRSYTLKLLAETCVQSALRKILQQGLHHVPWSVS